MSIDFEEIHMESKAQTQRNHSIAIGGNEAMIGTTNAATDVQNLVGFQSTGINTFGIKTDEK
jgi:hypothetical protein